MTESYIRFNCKWEKSVFQMTDLFCDRFNLERTKLFQLGLIGMYPNGIGFGNMSVRMKNSADFIITGSATGHLSRLESTHFALVSGYSFEENSVFCTGLTKASAESLSHAAVYLASSETGAVVHVHNEYLWEKLIHKLPTTAPEIEYGTPEMAFQIQSFASGMLASDPKIIIMGGHREGILAFGKNLEEATNEIIKTFNQNKHD
jgi:ribulose-5-phosphate 4-epimerase/fuculose-1-phosphate aldolase